MLFFAITNQGNREQNEDAFICLENGGYHCFAVADGLGGHGKGEVAAALATDAFAKAFSSLREKKVHTFLADTVMAAQKTILQEQVQIRARFDMKTTLVALCSNGRELGWVHVGDSRLYAFRKNKVIKRTLDHSVAQMLVYAGEIKEKDIRRHRDRNRLLKVLGTEWDAVQYELSDAYEEGDYQAFLLCTDGFWELIDEAQMCRMLKQSATPREWLLSMEEQIRACGEGKNMDNYTAVAVFCQEKRPEKSIKSLFDRRKSR